MFTLKLFDLTADSGCLHANVEEEWKVQFSQNFDSISSYITAFINSFKLIKI